MSSYSLALTAQRDLAAIRDYHLEIAGKRVAREVIVSFVEAFRLIGKNPGLGHKREDLAEDRDLLFWPVGDYLIVYRTHSDRVEIATIAHGYRDVATIISQRFP
jgi:plasmid stabilization system protein ParE